VNSTVLHLTDVCKSIVLSPGKRKQLLKTISFSVEKGSTTGFVGVNGAGKTTTLKSILGFLRIDSGQIKYFGETDFNANVRSRIGFMPERPYFYEFLTGREFLALHWELQGKVLKNGFEERCDEVLKKVDLERGKHLRLRQFSKGMLQRIGIAQAILHNPEFLILDEPMSGLDPDGRRLVKEIMRELARSGTTIFFSSHLLQDMEELCNHVVIVDQGIILYDGSLDHLLSRAGATVEIGFRTSNHKDIEKILCLPDKLQTHIDELRTHKSEILWIQKPNMQLEEAFQILRKDSMAKGAQL
jgi:ABC-2 type transport system ATP-binding protein